MARSTPNMLNAAHVADAVFTSMMLKQNNPPPQADRAHDLETLQSLMESIDTGLKSAGMSFAEYLERVRHGREIDAQVSAARWRFSARERAVQRVDHAVAHLCALVQTSGKCA